MFYSCVIVCCIHFCLFFLSFISQSFICKAAFRWWSRLKMPQLLFHATPQHLIGCNEHDADDESNGEGAYQALAHTSLLDLLRRARTCRGEEKKRWEEKREKRKIPEGPLDQVLFNAWKISDSNFQMKELITKPYNYMSTIIRDKHSQENLFSHLYAV